MLQEDRSLGAEVAHIQVAAPCSFHILEEERQVEDHIQVVVPHSLEGEPDSLVVVRHTLAKADILGEVDNLEEAHTQVVEEHHAHIHNQAVADNTLRAVAAEVHMPHQARDFELASAEGTRKVRQGLDA